MSEANGLLHEEFSDYEKVYLQMSRAFKPLNRQHWAIYCVCHINYEPPVNGAGTETAIREAWKHLAVEYPGLTVYPSGFEKKYRPLSESVLETWAGQTFSVETTENPDDIITKAEPRGLPGLLYLPRSSEILLLSQHWRTDGLGCCMLLNRLFQLLAFGSSVSAALQKGVPTLSPSMEVAAGASPEENEEIQAYSRERIAEFHAQAIKSGGLPFAGDAKKPPQNSRHLDLTFTTDETQAIVQACKDNATSTSAAIHAALAYTYFSFAEDEKEKQKGYTTVMAVNMRPHLQQPYNEPAHACQTYVASITPTVPYTAGFVDACRDLTREYHTWCTPKLLESLCWLYKYHAEKLFTPPKPPAVNGDAPAAPPKPPSGVTLSSIGVVERHLKHEYGESLSVDGFRFGVSTMTRQTLLYAWTFCGQLTLSFVYNEAYYSEQMAEDVLGRVKMNLMRGLAGPSLVVEKP